MTKFGDNSTSYPADMRVQLWPLCCGASIISGFKNVATNTVDQLVAKINELCDTAVPDHQVFAGETIKPTTIFLTLNGQQMASAKIIEAVTKAGFVQFGAKTGRNPGQGFWVRDTSKAFELVTTKGAKLAA